MRRAVFCVAPFLVVISCQRTPPLQKVEQQKPKPPSNRLLFAGDVMLSRGVRRQILSAHDPALPFRKIAPLMRAADIAFVNLESPFSDQGPYHQHGLIFHAAPETIAGLNLAGIAIASTANNHARDCGSHGVEFTVAWLRSHGITPLGSSESEAITHRGVILERKGVRFGFLGYTFDQANGNWQDTDNRIAVADIGTMSRDIDLLRKRADVVIVSVHNGIEYAPKPSQAQIAFAHAAIAAGATLVIGHHPHAVEPIEHYQNGVIVYSLGNFVFDQYQRVATQHGEIVEVCFSGNKIASMRTIPVRITPGGPEVETEQLASR